MIKHFDEYKIKVICNNLQKSFKDYDINCKIQVMNNGNVIQITGRRNLFFWIRLYYDNKNDKYIVDLNNVMLPEKLRGKHIFTHIFDRLKNCKYVEEIRITSVCTEDMKNWCMSHKLLYNGYSDYSLKT